MNKKRLGALGGLAVAIGLVAFIGSPQLQSQAPSGKSKSASIDEKLAQILTRLERVEKRLDALGAPPLRSKDLGILPKAKALTNAAKSNTATEILRLAAKPKPKATTFNGCPPAGEGKDRENNIRKNRVDPSAKWVPVPYDTVHDLDWPQDITRFRYNWSDEDRAAIAEYEGAAISIEGYIFTVKPNRSGESCNCGETTKDMIDYHIPLIKDKEGEEKDSIVVEVTPRIRDEHDSWDNKTIQRLADEQRKVRISGWLFFDSYHKSHLGKFRATLWEIHPIMEIDVYQNGSWIPLDDWVQHHQGRRFLPDERRGLAKAG